MFNICFCANESYVKYACVIMQSIVKNTDKSKSFKDFFTLDSIDSNKDVILSEEKNLTKNKNSKNYSGITHKILNYETLSQKDEGYIFHIFTDKLSDNMQKILNDFQNELSKIYPCKIKTHFIDSSHFHNAPKFSGNHLTYFRLLIPSFVDSDMAIYLDCDMLVLGDIRELFAIDLESSFAGVVLDIPHIPRTIKAKDSNRKDIIIESNYFNAGFLLLNLNAIKSISFWDKTLEIMKSYQLAYADQDILNIIFQHKILILSYAFDFMFPIFASYPLESANSGYDSKVINAAKNSPKIIHYTYPKPWWVWEDFLWKWDSFGIKVERDRMIFLLNAWWEVALNTPLFCDEMRKIKATLSKNDKLTLHTATRNVILANAENVKNKMRKRDRIYGTLFGIIFILLIVDIALQIWF